MFSCAGGFLFGCEFALSTSFSTSYSLLTSFMTRRRHWIHFWSQGHALLCVFTSSFSSSRAHNPLLQSSNTTATSSPMVHARSRRLQTPSSRPSSVWELCLEPSPLVFFSTRLVAGRPSASTSSFSPLVWLARPPLRTSLSSPSAGKPYPRPLFVYVVFFLTSPLSLFLALPSSLPPFLPSFQCACRSRRWRRVGWCARLPGSSLPFLFLFSRPARRPSVVAY